MALKTDKIFSAAFMLLFLIYPVVLSAQSLTGELWVEQDPVVMDFPEDKTAEENREINQETVKNLLEDFRWIFSGMIYGYKINWIPECRNRNVKEFFQMEPAAEIPWGDPALSVNSPVKENGLIYISVVYSLNEAQQSRRDGWLSSGFESSGGSGKSFLGVFSRKEAIENAVKNAIRNNLHSTGYNRPYRITGTVILENFPVFGVYGAYLTVKIKLRLNLNKPEAYFAD